ncbi:ATP-dependent zinc metalloprotease FtsH 4 [Labrenzia sp. THAF191b]|uniref:ATP-dependent zinc metalloprotease FtsH n=1 Tax=unclassified Labrenzia TaxID=2648686 RepID=UPI001267869C|nr:MULTISPECIES: ATP-dependent zinc metalloprotease FtsH [unclassified Labrenzia]QFS96085.1 ATP-dependent zinc metalloprotease FtsH 4 [Labrenzia sp. THAF191b]QFT02400.1 ATP-dependent zinc metalloprotease FtsH 4 [Labrenzia sp. THAF191a]QFT13942.1 ATP-dependent zinc metalloprotease FtsH 4 [Labrenzia sp. THAF187b]
MEKKHQINLWYAFIAMMLVLMFQSWWTTYKTVEQIPYSQFEQYLKDGKIEEIAVKENFIEGKFKAELKDGKQYFVTTRVEVPLADELSKYDVKYTGVVQNTFIRDILSWVLPVLLLFGLWMFFIRRFAEKQGLGGMMTVGKSKAKVFVEKDVKVTFQNVAGVDEAKRELKEIVDFLKEPASYGRLGAHVPKGILLVGPPGTGKTLLARAVAGEAGVPFFSISGSEFVEMFVGVGAARVRDLFEQARKAAPAIIFIDELDALGRARASGPMGTNDEKEQTLNQLLTELDGFDPSSGIILLAATNRPEILDPALLRAGRFDRQVLVDRPDKIGRRAILDVHVKKIKLAADIDLDQVAQLTAGFSGADLATLVNEAALLATRRKADAVTLLDFNEAVERVIAGLEKRSRILSDKERKTVAFHEMGHALVAANLEGCDPVHKISIIPRGIGALGYTMQRPTEDRFLLSALDLENRMAVLMGGRAAEEIVFNEISTGASDDLQKVTEVARDMVMRYGMDPDLGNRAYATQRQNFLGQPAGDVAEVSEQTQREIDLAIKQRVEAAFQRAKALLNSHRGELDEGASLLLAKETLTDQDFPAIRPLAERRKTEAAE